MARWQWLRVREIISIFVAINASVSGSTIGLPLFMHVLILLADKSSS